ncbi:MAG: TerC family protein [Planctomycetia bacterium]|nr:TerC family protein [Planctomycetia bacterium]
MSLATMVWVWIGFILFILAMLALDLGVLNRGAHVISAKQAMGWTVFWVFLAMVFNVAVYFIYEHHWQGFGASGRAIAAKQAAGEELTKEEEHLRRYLPADGKEAAIQFFLGYLVEESLSLDNIFVMAVIFAKFRVPAKHQHRVLFWGIIGAQVMRGIMIGAGSAVIQQWQWITYVFGAFLIYTAFKMFFSGDDEVDPENNLLVRWARKIYPVTPGYVEGKFFVQHEGKRAMTPLFLVLLVIESTDLLFAVDSVPAVFGITQDPFLVFTSNIFAILGLRSMYFALAAVLEKFRYLKYSLVFLLAFIGVKMLLVYFDIHFSPVMSLVIIGGILASGVFASVLRPEQHEEAAGEASTGAEE